MSVWPTDVRKTVTILFADLTGSTDLAESLDPEALRRVTFRFFDEMRAAVEHHGGTVEKYAGDDVLAVFGVPTLHEDDAVRAVRAAEAMHERLDLLNEELERSWGIRLQVRIGINTGEVVTSERPGEKTIATGQAVNVAKRIQQAAAPGEILIGKATYPLVKDAVTAGPLERFPITPGRDGERRRLDAIDPASPGLARRLDVPMVGREHELAALRHALQRASDERACRLFTVLGAAGIGKSRLAAELIASAGDNAHTVTGRCLSYGEGITFWPLAEIVRELGGEQALRERLGSADDAERVAELILSLTGASSETTSSEDTFWAVRRLFEALAADRPLIVCLEDIHWAEPTLLDLIEYVAGWSRGAPILIVCLARPDLVDRRPGWITRRPNADTVALEPLSSGQAGALLEQFRGDVKLSDEAYSRIAEAAEGNPLFVEQMVALAAESGADGDLAIPPSIHALLAERLDRLPAPERAIVERAAVVGRDFTARALAELTPSDERDAAAGHLLALVRKQLIRPEASTASAEDRYAFHHVLVRDVAYGAMSKDLRATLHEQLADWAEDGDSTREPDELVGYHLEQAYCFRSELGGADGSLDALAARAAARLGSAGRRASGRGDARAAVGLLERAASLLECRPDGRHALLPDLGGALRDAGQLDESERVLTEAAEAADAAADRGAEARARLERAFTRVHSEEGLEEAGAVAEAALPVLTELGDDSGVARALSLAGLAEYVRCRVLAGEAQLERALAHAERTRDRRLARSILTLLAKTNLDGPRDAEAAIVRSLELQSRLPDDPALSAVLATNRAPLEAMRGRFAEARELCERAEQTLEELGRTFSLATMRLDSGGVELLAGDVEAAEREFRWGLDALEQIGESSVRSSMAAMLGQALLVRGANAEAERLAEISQRTSSAEDVFSQVEWRTLRAVIDARAGRVDEALTLGQEAVALLDGADALNLSAAAIAALAEGLEAAGQAADARQKLAEAARLYERKGNTAAAGRLLARSGGQPPPSPSRSATA